MQSLGLGVPAFNVQAPNATPERQTNERAQEEARVQQPAPQQQQQGGAAANDANGIADERENDWLGILHNAASCLIIFSFIYLYSSLTRFIIVFTAVTLLFL